MEENKGNFDPFSSLLRTYNIHARFIHYNHVRDISLSILGTLNLFPNSRKYISVTIRLDNLTRVNVYNCGRIYTRKKNQRNSHMVNFYCIVQYLQVY